MSKYRERWLVRWSKDCQSEEEVLESQDAAETRITRLLLDGIHPSTIALYRSADWNFEIAAYVKGTRPEDAI